MTTITFPKRLPYPTVEGYSIRPDEAIIRTDMEAGPARQRRRYTQTPSKIAVKWIMSPEQFCLFEAWYKYYAKEGAEWFVITLLGGIIGILIGVTGAYGVCALIGFTAKVNLSTVLGASLFSSAVGIFFGIYPARKAAKLSPIEALRHE